MNTACAILFAFLSFVGVQPAEAQQITSIVYTAAYSYVDEPNNLLYAFDNDTGRLTVSVVAKDTDCGPVSRVGWYRATAHASERAIFYRLKSIAIRNGVKAVDSSAFSDCQALASVDFAPSVEQIGSLAFANCNSLATVTGLSEQADIGWWVFYRTPAMPEG